MTNPFTATGDDFGVADCRSGHSLRLDAGSVRECRGPLSGVPYYSAWRILRSGYDRVYFGSDKQDCEVRPVEDAL